MEGDISRRILVGMHFLFKTESSREHFHSIVTRSAILYNKQIVIV